LKHKPDLGYTSSSGKTALMLAAILAHTQAITLLLEAKADIDQEVPEGFGQFGEQGMTALMFAAQADNEKTTLALLAAGASIRNGRGNTVFEYAKAEIALRIEEQLRICQT